MYKMFGKKLLAGPDYVKVIFVCLINPALCELLMIVPMRFTARSLRHNHPSTSYMLVALAIIPKQVVGRAVAAMVMDVRWLWVLAVVGSVNEFALRVTMRWRDKQVYR